MVKAKSKLRLRFHTRIRVGEHVWTKKLIYRDLLCSGECCNSLCKTASSDKLRPSFGQAAHSFEICGGDDAFVFTSNFTPHRVVIDIACGSISGLYAETTAKTNCTGTGRKPSSIRQCIMPLPPINSPSMTSTKSGYTS